MSAETGATMTELENRILEVYYLLSEEQKKLLILSARLSSFPPVQESSSVDQDSSDLHTS